MSNFLNKVISRILVERLAGVLPRIISPQQSGFVKGRSMANNFLLAQELMSEIGRKCRVENLALKLDMAKAYDRVSWPFLIAVLRRFGFGERFIDMVWWLISNVWFSMLVNGVPYDFFKSSCGSRQGDPLSPALFIIGSEFLSWALNALVSHSRVVGYKVLRYCPLVSHLVFADDVIVFANGGADSLKRVMQILECYQSDSGQLVNVQKSGYLVHPRITVARKRVIERVTHFHKRELPVRYLVAPLFIGRAKEAYYSDLCQKVLDKVLSWKFHLLSFGRKLILIRHVLSSIPIHLLAVGVIPKGTFRLIERVCADFL